MTTERFKENGSILGHPDAFMQFCRISETVLFWLSPSPCRWLCSEWPLPSPPQGAAREALHSEVSRRHLIVQVKNTTSREFCSHSLLWKYEPPKIFLKFRIEIMGKLKIFINCINQFYKYNTSILYINIYYRYIINICIFIIYVHIYI